jgi:hypothetical protein
LKSYISTILAFFLLSCERKADERFTKTWYDTEYRIPGKSTLKIKSDFTFRYNARGCDWHTISKGKWKVIGDTIELNSVGIDTCYNMFPFAECLKFGENINRKIQTTIPNCSTESGKVYTIFNKEKFYFKNDSLVYIRNANSNCTELLKIVFAKTEKIKKNDY